MAGLLERTEGSLTFLSVHPVLDQMAHDILRGLPEGACDGPQTTVYCGVHRDFGTEWARSGYRIALQTEQLFDAGGTPLWPMRKPSNLRHILRAARKAHRVLDLSPFNRAFYAEADPRPKIQRKLVFGPHIFPSAPVPYTPPIRDEAIFVGWTGGKRRKRILRGITGFGVTIVEDGTFFEALTAQIRDHRAMLNIHFEEGTYTEVPRLLTSYLCGKPVISERLDPVFEPGLHYHLLDDPAPMDPERLFSAFSAQVTGRFRFADFLHSCGDRHR